MTATVIFTTNTKKATSFSFPGLHANELMNESLQEIDLKIDYYDMIIVSDLISSLGIKIHGTDITIHWDHVAIPWHDIYSTTNNVFALSQYNGPFDSVTKRMKCIINANYKMPIL